MTMKLFAIAGLALAISAPLAHAQEGWGEERGEHMREFRMACENGDERACWRLRHMRHEWREHHRWHEDEYDRSDRPRGPYQNDRW